MEPSSSMIFSPLTGFHYKGPIKPHHQRHPLTLKQNWKPTGQSVSSSSFKVAGITFAKGHGLLHTRPPYNTKSKLWAWLALAAPVLSSIIKGGGAGEPSSDSVCSCLKFSLVADLVQLGSYFCRKMGVCADCLLFTQAFRVFWALGSALVPLGSTWA